MSNIHAWHDSEVQYRHEDHSANLSDVIKHLVLTALQPTPAVRIAWDAFAASPMTPIKQLPAARRDMLDSLMRSEGPAVLRRYQGYLQACQTPSGEPAYPGSAWILSRSRELVTLLLSDRRESCIEQHRRCFADIGLPRIEALCLDSYQQGEVLMSRSPELVLIDPPFLDSGEWTRVTAFQQSLSELSPSGKRVLWYPLRDDLRPPPAHRQLPRVELQVNFDRSGPMKGCAMALFQFGPDVLPGLQDLADWLKVTSPLPIGGVELVQY